MNGRILGRGFGAFMALALMLSVTAMPAFGEPMPATASINTAHRMNLAGGTDVPFEITVTSPQFSGDGLLAKPVNFVRVIPPHGDYTAVQGIAPAGWISRVTANNNIMFEAKDNPILAGTSKAFTVIANLSRPPLDNNRRWRVYNSDDGGNVMVESEPTGAGALNTQIRVLKVTSVALTAPAGVTDNSVTENQTASAAMTVVNAGSGNLTVTPTLTSNRSSDQISCPASAPIGAGSQIIVNCTVTFGAKGTAATARLTGDANTEGADGIPFTGDAISVMSQVGLSYSNLSLSPREVAAGQSYPFRLTVSKTGDVSANLNKGGTTFRFGDNDEFIASLAEPATLPAGNANVLLEFVSTRVPDDFPVNADGYSEHIPRLRVVATDQNDFGVDRSPGITDKVTVDILGPILILARPDAGGPDVEGAEKATSNGRRTNLSGRIEDRGKLCTNCTISGTVLRQYTSSGARLDDIPVTLTNSGGVLSGSYSGNYSPQAVRMSLAGVAADVPGHTT
ncbi:MAG: hypothetical protein M3275_03725, partial [Thermoproteota archaeon]|nr:hypothetical protein [Thermoproteota archaeon]